MIGKKVIPKILLPRSFGQTALKRASLTSSVFGARGLIDLGRELEWRRVGTARTFLGRHRNRAPSISVISQPQRLRLSASAGEL
jgi:hypothetical protein